MKLTKQEGAKGKSVSMTKSAQFSASFESFKLFMVETWASSCILETAHDRNLGQLFSIHCTPNAKYMWILCFAADFLLQFHIQLIFDHELKLV